MPDPDTLVLVLVRYGAVGSCCPEDGQVLRLPADKAAELVARGDAVPVSPYGSTSYRGEYLRARDSTPKTAPAGSPRESR